MKNLAALILSALIVVALVALFVIAVKIGGWMWLLAIFSLLVMIPPLAWLLGILGQIEISEGTGTAFKLLGRYCGSIISLSEPKKCHLGIDEFIVPGTGPSSTCSLWFVWSLRGWVFYIKGLVEATKYTDQNKPDGFGEGCFVFLNEIQHTINLEKAETMAGEEIAINLKAVFKMKVVNIYLFLFIAPEDVIDKVIEIMESVTSRWIRASSYQTVQGLKSGGASMWSQLSPELQESILSVKNNWGLEILDDSIHIMAVGLLDSDQDAFAAEKRQQLKINAAAKEILGGMLAMEALARGLKDDDVTKVVEGQALAKKTGIEKVLEVLESTSDGKKRLETMINEANQVVIQRAKGAKVNLFGNADGSNLDPVAAAVASWISLAIGQGGPPPSPTATGGGSGGGQNQGGSGGQGKKRRRAPGDPGPSS